MKKLVLLLFVSSIAFSQVTHDLSVTYLANAGFMISYHKKHVIIDALFNQSFGKYDPPGAELISKMQNGDEPFNHIDLYLILIFPRCQHNISRRS